MRFVLVVVGFCLLSAGNAWAEKEMTTDHAEETHDHASHVEKEHDDHDREHGDEDQHEAHEEAEHHEDADDEHDHDHAASKPGIAPTEGTEDAHDRSGDGQEPHRDDGHDHAAERHSEHDDHADEGTKTDGHDDHDHAAERNSEHDDHADESIMTDGHDDHGHADDGQDDHADEVHLRPEQIQALGVKTERLVARPLGEVRQAPGEVRINRYTTDRVAPRIGAQVIARHARLGDHVEAAQPLVTLSSVEMAEAQGAVVVAAREWQRVRSLGRKVVAESRYIEAQIAQQQSRAKAISYGMTSEQVDTLLRKGASKADGSFMLLAPRAGTVVADDFIIGEIVEPGRALFEITDESVRWVEAGFSPTDAGQIHIGDVAHIRIGSDRMSGRVSQIHHVLDETTRTRAVRIEVPDPEHRLHPGEFVDVAIEAGEGAPVLALPEEAVLRSQDGDWQVFVAGDEPGAYRPVEVDRRYATGGLAVVEGIAAGTEVVTRGAFFLASELAKGGFDPHNH